MPPPCGRGLPPSPRRRGLQGRHPLRCDRLRRGPERYSRAGASYAAHSGRALAAQPEPKAVREVLQQIADQVIARKDEPLQLALLTIRCIATQAEPDAGRREAPEGPPPKATRAVRRVTRQLRRSRPARCRSRHLLPAGCSSGMLLEGRIRDAVGILEAHRGNRRD